MAEEQMDIAAEVRAQVAAEDEMLAAAKKGGGHGGGNDRDGENKIDPEEVEKAYYLNEQGDAELLIRMFKGKFLYDNAEKKLYKFNCTHYYLDINNSLAQAVYKIADLYSERAVYYTKMANEIGENGDPATKKKILRKAKDYNDRASQLRGRRRINNVISLAIQGEGTIGMDGEMWNQNHTLLPCANGVIDLATGKILAGSPEYMFNRASPIEFKGLNAEAPCWMDTLKKIFCAREELQEYFEYFVGSAATGIQPKLFFMVCGEKGNNGKSIIFERIRDVLGKFVANIDIEMLLEDRNVRSASGPSPEIINLKGLRLAYTSEAQRTHRFSLSKIKKFSAGGDNLTGRALNSNVIVNFAQTHTLACHANDIPSSSAYDQAFFARMVVFPFNALFVPREGKVIKGRLIKPDPDRYIFEEIPRHKMEARLDAEMPGILAWIVRCAKKFLANGGEMPPPPPMVQAKTKEYQDDQDLVGQWIAACCDLNPAAAEQMKNLYESFKSWCIDEMRIPEKHVKSMKALAHEFKAIPDMEKQEGRVTMYKGIRIMERSQENEW